MWDRERKNNTNIMNISEEINISNVFFKALKSLHSFLLSITRSASVPRPLRNAILSRVPDHIFSDTIPKDIRDLLCESFNMKYTKITVDQIYSWLDETTRTSISINAERLRIFQSKEYLMVDHKDLRELQVLYHLGRASRQGKIQILMDMINHKWPDYIDLDYLVEHIEIVNTLESDDNVFYLAVINSIREIN